MNEEERIEEEGGDDGQLRWVALEEIRLVEPFASLFERDPERVKLIARSIQERGYDTAHPVTVWANGKYRQRGALIDGYTRYAAVTLAGCTEGKIWACFRKIPSEEQAIDYALEAQGWRRNLTDWGIFYTIRALDGRGTWGGKRAGCGKKGRAEEPSGEENPVDSDSSSEALYQEMVAGERARDRLSYRLQVGRRKLDECFALISHGSEAELALIKEQSIHAAYLALRARRREEARTQQTGESAAAPPESYWHYQAGRLFVKRAGKISRLLELDTHAFPSPEDRLAFEEGLGKLLRRHLSHWTATPQAGLEPLSEAERRQLELEFGWEALA